MKSLVLFIFTAGLLVQSAAAVDFIRQVQLIEDQTIVYDTPVAWETGEIRSQPVFGTGAIFQLYAYNDPAYSPYSILDAQAGSILSANVSLDSHLVDLDLLGIHLDITLGSDSTEDSLPNLVYEKTVGAYLPEATVTLSSEDTYVPIRTRADQPYGVSVAISRLPDADADVPETAPTSVRLAKSYKLYHPTLHVPSDNGSGQGVYGGAYELSRNGTFSIPTVYQELPAESPTRAIGEETHFVQVAVGPDKALATIGSATIQIWPVAVAKIEGIPEPAKFTGIPANLTMEVTDPYPQSQTYAQIYKGEPELGRSGAVITSSIIVLNDYAPPSEPVKLPLLDLDSLIDDDGIYTIEIVTVTPFNGGEPERIAYTSFELDRSVKVRSLATTLNP
ncbi:hypothetical protein JIN85_16440 [Luteolibacter pohnpeiensis]|uniref:Uncharacterized protein n=1 Tax=Luteolibacter pohnpeiensis TaxID=454153 RepID=A0A934S9T9_9BACT|nr:hypothetical protein [Luteolibacter pohnpeiensis]MBK1884010.1 hypothetical protein [Luteolibacter pohnpeiensis]